MKEDQQHVVICFPRVVVASWPGAVQRSRQALYAEDQRQRRAPIAASTCMPTALRTVLSPRSRPVPIRLTCVVSSLLVHLTYDARNLAQSKREREVALERRFGRCGRCAAMCRVLGAGIVDAGRRVDMGTCTGHRHGVGRRW